MSVRRNAGLAAGVAVSAIALFTACSDLPVSPSGRAMGAGSDPLYSTTTNDSARAQKEAEEAAKKAAHELAEAAKKAAERAKHKKVKEVAPTLVDVLEWDHPVSNKTESKVIGPHGGTLPIPGGARLVVPEGALSENVTISVTRLAGKIVAYEFEPHGLRFAVPARIEQPTDHTNLHDVSSPWKDISGAYFESVNSLNQGKGTATVIEFEPTLISWDKKWIKFRVEHFSGYLVSSGRHGDEGEGGPHGY